MKKFRTGALVWKEEINTPFIKGRNFCFLFEDHKYKHSSISNKELIIVCADKQKAQNFYDLYQAAIALVQGHLSSFMHDMPDVMSYHGNDFGKPHLNLIKNMQIYSSSGLFEAAVLAAKASNRIMFTNSIFKYLLSCNIHSNIGIQLDPHESDYMKMTKDRFAHLRYGYAILILYSVLEELGLEIRASEKNPSKINGKWNPTVRLDLENRLKSATVDIKKKATWLVRSKPTNIHQKGKLSLGKKEKWARFMIRDSKIEIVDAISHLSWLRSKVVAHRLNELFLSITIYDVASANYLIRQILLDILH